MYGDEYEVSEDEETERAKPAPQIIIKKEADVTEIRYIHSIWLRATKRRKNMVSTTKSRSSCRYILLDKPGFVVPFITDAFHSYIFSAVFDF